MINKSLTYYPVTQPPSHDHDSDITAYSTNKNSLKLITEYSLKKSTANTPNTTDHSKSISYSTFPYHHHFQVKKNRKCTDNTDTTDPISITTSNTFSIYQTIFSIMTMLSYPKYSLKKYTTVNPEPNSLLRN